MTIEFPVMADVIPAGVFGEARVDHFEITEHEARFANLRQAINPQRYNQYDLIVPGKYARLSVGGELVMTDTPMERLTNREFMRAAHGRVLIGGLGLGMILHPLLQKQDVEQVTVIERSADVITLVAPTLDTPERPAQCGLTIIHADVFNWQPPRGERWNTIYFDIWPNICGDYADEIARLHRKYARYLDRSDPRCWMGSWRADDMRRARSRYA